MTNSSSYPADGATQAVTGCAEVIFEIESASEGQVRVDSIPAPTSSYPRPPEGRAEDRIRIPDNRKQRRLGLRTWLKHNVIRRT